LDFEILWHRGSYYFNNRDILLVRKLLNTPNENPLLTMYQKVLTARMMLASLSPVPKPEGAYTEYREEQLVRNFGHFGIPSTYFERRFRARTMLKRTQKKLETVLKHLRYMYRETFRDDGPMLTEETVRERFARHPDYQQIFDLVEEIRNMQETGGDLDTVASAVFYTRFILQDAAAQGKELVYGTGYRYGFVNYHEGLRHLSAFAPCDVLIADFPSGAIPDIDGDIRFLADHDVFVERFEDHHPYTQETVEIFDRLQAKGMLGFYELTGPIDGGAEIPEDNLKCGADMVHANLIESTPYDSDGCRSLRRAAHSEDFVSGQYEEGITLTEIIKGDICKIEIVQTLLKSLDDDRMMDHLAAKGWTTLVESWNEYYASIEERLLENVYVVECGRPESSTAQSGGPSLGPGSDVPLPVPPQDKTVKPLSLLFALATYTEKGKPKFYVGKATEYYRKKFPGMDYLFYCYGSNLIIGRRLNQADYSMNLGEIMPQIGSEGDGGHAAAAVGRPSDNRDYPKTLLGRIDRKNFRQFVRYMAHRLDGLGYKTVAVHDVSTQPELFSRRKGIQLLVIIAAAFLLGLLFVILDSSYSPKEVMRSNREFFPQIRQDN
ncbi:MAG: hypothetical protein ACOCWH_00745, partial [Spirochaetota bacterium]